MLDPQIFRHARRVLKFKPWVGLFASDFHHQLPMFYALEADPNAAGRDAFTANWLLELRPYIIVPSPRPHTCFPTTRRMWKHVLTHASTPFPFSTLIVTACALSAFHAMSGTKSRPHNDKKTPEQTRPRAEPREDSPWRPKNVVDTGRCTQKSIITNDAIKEV